MILVLRVFPTLIAPFILYLLFLSGGPAALGSGHAAILHIPMIGGNAVAINAADIVALATIICLSIDLGAAASTATTSIVHLCVDAILAVVFVILFLMFSAFATATFLMLATAALLEFMVGAGITVVSARRDVAYGSNT